MAMDGISLAKDLLSSIKDTIEKSESNRQALRSLNRSLERMLDALEEGLSSELISGNGDSVRENRFLEACEMVKSLCIRLRILVLSRQHQTKIRGFRKADDDAREIESISKEIMLMQGTFTIKVSTSQVEMLNEHKSMISHLVQTIGSLNQEVNILRESVGQPRPTIGIPPTPISRRSTDAGSEDGVPEDEDKEAEDETLARMIVGSPTVGDSEEEEERTGDGEVGEGCLSNPTTGGRGSNEDQAVAAADGVESDGGEESSVEELRQISTGVQVDADFGAYGDSRLPPSSSPPGQPLHKSRPFTSRPATHHPHSSSSFSSNHHSKLHLPHPIASAKDKFTKHRTSSSETNNGTFPNSKIADAILAITSNLVEGSVSSPSLTTNTVGTMTSHPGGGGSGHGRKISVSNLRHYLDKEKDKKKMDKTSLEDVGGLPNLDSLPNNYNSIVKLDSTTTTPFPPSSSSPTYFVNGRNSLDGPSSAAAETRTKVNIQTGRGPGAHRVGAIEGGVSRMNGGSRRATDGSAESSSSKLTTKPLGMDGTSGDGGTRTTTAAATSREQLLGLPSSFASASTSTVTLESGSHHKASSTGQLQKFHMADNMTIDWSDSASNEGSFRMIPNRPVFMTNGSERKASSGTNPMEGMDISEEAVDDSDDDGDHHPYLSQRRGNRKGKGKAKRYESIIVVEDDEDNDSLFGIPLHGKGSSSVLDEDKYEYVLDPYVPGRKIKLLKPQFRQTTPAIESRSSGDITDGNGDETQHAINIPGTARATGIRHSSSLTSDSPSIFSSTVGPLSSSPSAISIHDRDPLSFSANPARRQHSPSLSSAPNNRDGRHSSGVGKGKMPVKSAVPTRLKLENNESATPSLMVSIATPPGSAGGSYRKSDKGISMSGQNTEGGWGRDSDHHRTLRARPGADRVDGLGEVEGEEHQLEEGITLVGLREKMRHSLTSNSAHISGSSNDVNGTRKRNSKSSSKRHQTGSNLSTSSPLLVDISDDAGETIREGYDDIDDIRGTERDGGHRFHSKSPSTCSSGGHDQDPEPLLGGQTGEVTNDLWGLNMNIDHHNLENHYGPAAAAPIPGAVPTNQYHQGSSYSSAASSSFPQSLSVPDQDVFKGSPGSMPLPSPSNSRSRRPLPPRPPPSLPLSSSLSASVSVSTSASSATISTLATVKQEDGYFPDHCYHEYDYDDHECDQGYSVEEMSNGFSNSHHLQEYHHQQDQEQQSLNVLDHRSHRPLPSHPPSSQPQSRSRLVLDTINTSMPSRSQNRYGHYSGLTSSPIDTNLEDGEDEEHGVIDASNMYGNNDNSDEGCLFFGAEDLIDDDDGAEPMREGDWDFRRRKVIGDRGRKIHLHYRDNGHTNSVLGYYGH